MTDTIWFRPKGTRAPREGRLPSQYDLWYRLRANGQLETTVGGMQNWDRTLPSYDFPTVEDLLQSGLCVQVRAVGDRIPTDPDTWVDEGL